MSKIQLIKPSDIAAVIEPGKTRDWKFIVFHHTGNPDGHMTTNWKTNERIKETRMLYGDDIEKSHVDHRGFQNGMGYHFLINPNGHIQFGKRWAEQLNGAHTLVNIKDRKLSKSYVNTFGIGIGLIGNFNNYDPTLAQMQSSICLLEALLNFTGLTLSDVEGHNYFTRKSCPGKNFPLAELKETVLYKMTGDLDHIAESMESIDIEFDKVSLDKNVTKLEMHKNLTKIIDYIKGEKYGSKK